MLEGRAYRALLLPPLAVAVVVLRLLARGLRPVVVDGGDARRDPTGLFEMRLAEGWGGVVTPTEIRTALDVLYAGGALVLKGDPGTLRAVAKATGDLDLAVTALRMEPRPAWLRAMVGDRLRTPASQREAR